MTIQRVPRNKAHEH